MNIITSEPLTRFSHYSMARSTSRLLTQPKATGMLSLTMTLVSCAPSTRPLGGTGLSIVASQDIFQWKLDDIYKNMPNVTGIADDIIVFGSIEDEHDQALVNILKPLGPTMQVWTLQNCSLSNKVSISLATHWHRMVFAQQLISWKLSSLSPHQPMPRNFCPYWDWLPTLTASQPRLQSLLHPFVS